jgi:hypothetical protein
MSGDKIKMTYMETCGQEFVRPEYRVRLVELSTPEEVAAFVQGFYAAKYGGIDLKADGKPV